MIISGSLAYKASAYETPQGYLRLEILHKSRWSWDLSKADPGHYRLPVRGGLKVKLYKHKFIYK